MRRMHVERKKYLHEKQITVQNDIRILKKERTEFEEIVQSCSIERR